MKVVRFRGDAKTPGLDLLPKEYGKDELVPGNSYELAQPPVNGMN